MFSYMPTPVCFWSFLRQFTSFLENSAKPLVTNEITNFRFSSEIKPHIFVFTERRVHQCFHFSPYFRKIGKLYYRVPYIFCVLIASLHFWLQYTCHETSSAVKSWAFGQQNCHAWVIHHSAYQSLTKYCEANKQLPYPWSTWRDGDHQQSAFTIPGWRLESGMNCNCKASALLNQIPRPGCNSTTIFLDWARLRYWLHRDRDICYMIDLHNGQLCYRAARESHTANNE